MAWRSHGTSNETLIQELWRNGLIKTERVRDAFLKVSHLIKDLPHRDTRPINSAAFSFFLLLFNVTIVSTDVRCWLRLASQVDRGHYAPRNPYNDSPQSIGHAATISAPHMHASAVEHLVERIVPESAPRVLDIGSGSGYLTHVFAELVGDKGLVV